MRHCRLVGEPETTQTGSVQFKRYLRMAGVRRPRMLEDGDSRVERGEMRRCSVHRKHKEAG